MYRVWKMGRFLIKSFNARRDLPIQILWKKAGIFKTNLKILWKKVQLLLKFPSVTNHSSFSVSSSETINSVSNPGAKSSLTHLCSDCQYNTLIFKFENDSADNIYQYLKQIQQRFISFTELYIRNKTYKFQR